MSMVRMKEVKKTWSQCVSTDMMASRLSGSDPLSREAWNLVLETLATCCRTQYEEHLQQLINPGSTQDYLGLVARKPVFGVSD